MGNPWTSTYPAHDVAPPDMRVLWDNIAFYFWGKGSRWVGFAALAVVSAFCLKRFWKPSREEKGYLALLVGVPFLYFFTHSISIAYYLYPTLVLALLSWALLMLHEKRGGSVFPQDFFERSLSMGAVSLVGAGILYFGAQLVQPYPKLQDFNGRVNARVRRLLQDPKMVLWAEYYSGTVEYEHGKPAFKLTQTTPEVRQAVYGYARSKGWTQYWLMDHDQGHKIRSELKAQGARLVAEGRLYGANLYRIDFE